MFLFTSHLGLFHFKKCVYFRVIANGFNKDSYKWSFELDRESCGPTNEHFWLLGMLSISMKFKTWQSAVFKKPLNTSVYIIIFPLTVS